MVDGRADIAGAGTRLALFVRSLVLFALIAVALPWALGLAAQERFGGASPFHGVASPADWSVSRVRGALTDRLTDQTIADILIRLALVVAWVGVIVIVVTVVAEAVHMLRHDGLALPDIRGLGFSQRTARVIATGLVVIVPLVGSPTGALARHRTSSLPGTAPTSVLGAASTTTPEPVRTPGAEQVDAPRSSGASASTGRYVVRSGDSIFGIAERLAGPDSSRVADFAERMVELNLGREMPDGRRFDNAAFIDVGWVLELPDVPVRHDVDAGDAAGSAVGVGDVHVVEEGDTLWSIADEELGDPFRWPEVYDANDDEPFADGGNLDDPDLIRPGWALDIPTDDADVEPPVDHVPAPVVDPEPPVPEAGRSSAPPADTSSAPSPPVVAPLEEIAPVVVTDADGAVAHADARADPPAGHTNIWHEADGVAALDVSQRDVGSEPPADGSSAEEREVDDPSAPGLLPLGGAAMLSAGVLSLLAVRRRNRLRRARPRAFLPEPTERPATTERALRSIDAGERFDRVDAAIRGVAVAIADQGRRVQAVLVGPDGALEVRTTGPTRLPSPWEGAGISWHLAASTPLEFLVDAARAVGTPCPTLVQLGTQPDGRDVYVDLEAIEAIEVGGPGSDAESIVAAVAATLAGSVLAEVTTLVGVGVPDHAFLGHRRYVPTRDARSAFAAAADAIGSTAAMTGSTFALRVSGSATETWEPAVVLAGAAVGTLNPPTDRRGMAVVSASPVQGPSSRLAPDGDAWLLLPAGIRLTPVGLSADDLEAISELVTVIDPVPIDPRPTTPRLERVGLDDDHTLVPDAEMTGSVVADDVSPPDIDDIDDIDDVDLTGDVDAVVVTQPPFELLVRMIGPVDIVDRDGSPVVFERSKTRELVAWLATHRERSTRSSARTALWELDVRDATFANVVSEARRSLARLVEPPEGEEWVARTMTDALPLHDLVVTDADLIRHALDAARVQPPTQAIATLSPAVDLIAGVPFEGTSYLWPDSEGITSNLVLLATSATTELAAHCLSIGDIDGVFRATGRGLQVLPGHEELIGLRMEAHARAGDHAGVRQEWESYERVINADPWSDGEPAPKLVELRRRLLNPSR